MGTDSKLCPVIKRKCVFYEPIDFTDEGEAVTKCKHPSNKSGKVVKHLCPNAPFLLESAGAPDKTLAEKLRAEMRSFCQDGVMEDLSNRLDRLENLSVALAVTLVRKEVFTEVEALEMFRHAHY